MKILKKIFIVLIALVVIAGIAGLFMPSKFTLDKSIVINAGQKVIFDQINILKNWEQWSPWYKMDPETKMTYNDIPAGVGANYSFVSSKNGEGTITISESVPNESLALSMDFKGNGTSTAGFKLGQAEGGNKLAWWFETDMGSNPFKKVMFGILGRYFLSTAYEQGLNDIKKIAESAPAPSAVPETMPADTLATDSVK